jgi:cytochrome c-type biogenesis protein CcmH/NrfF
MDVMASHFLAGAVLSWALPIALLIAVGIYWSVILRRRSGRGT